MSDDEHARAHAKDLPDYVTRGERPTTFQIVAFGAAGGLIPCPASISVMLLALSIGAAGLGFLTVLAFSAGLAVTLVGVGLAVVAGLTQLSRSGRFSWLTRQAPLISAGMVLLSGCFALAMAH
jgi:nickel/cobalt exporter